jgi:hypothetical protein
MSKWMAEHPVMTVFMVVNVFANLFWVSLKIAAADETMNTTVDGGV